MTERNRDYWDGYARGKRDGRAGLAEEIARGRQVEADIARLQAEQERRWAEQAGEPSGETGG